MLSEGAPPPALSAADFGGDAVGGLLVVIGDDEDAPTLFGNVGVGIAVADGHGEDRRLFEARRPVDETAHLRVRGGVIADLAAIVQRHDRAHFAAQGGERDIDEVVGAFHRVGVRIFLVQHDDV